VEMSDADSSAAAGLQPLPSARKASKSTSKGSDKDTRGSGGGGGSGPGAKLPPAPSPAVTAMPSMRGSGRRDIEEMHNAAVAAAAHALGHGAHKRGIADVEEFIAHSRVASANSRVSTPIGRGLASQMAAASGGGGGGNQALLPGTSPQRGTGQGGSSSSVQGSGAGGGSISGQSPERFSASSSRHGGGGRKQSHLSPPHGSSIPFTPMDGGYMLGGGGGRSGASVVQVGGPGQPVLYQSTGAGGRAGGHLTSLARAPSRGDPWDSPHHHQRGGGQQVRPTTQQGGQTERGGQQGSPGYGAIPPLPPGWRNSGAAAGSMGGERMDSHSPLTRSSQQWGGGSSIGGGDDDDTYSGHGQYGGGGGGLRGTGMYGRGTAAAGGYGDPMMVVTSSQSGHDLRPGTRSKHDASGLGFNPYGHPLGHMQRRNRDTYA
jgi:hypothetical protein